MRSIQIYVAGFFDTRERLVPFVEKLRGLGYGVSSTWLLERTLTPVSKEVQMRYAVRDYDEIADADWLVVDTFDITPRGGREVEIGLAMAWHKKVYVVGPERNVFHTLADARFDSWEEFLEFAGA